MGVVRELYGSCTGVVRELYGSCMGVVWELYRRCMGGVWKHLDVFGIYIRKIKLPVIKVADLDRASINV